MFIDVDAKQAYIWVLIKQEVFTSICHESNKPEFQSQKGHFVKMQSIVNRTYSTCKVSTDSSNWQARKNTAIITKFKNTCIIRIPSHIKLYQHLFMLLYPVQRSCMFLAPLGHSLRDLSKEVYLQTLLIFQEKNTLIYTFISSLCLNSCMHEKIW